MGGLYETFFLKPEKILYCTVYIISILFKINLAILASKLNFARSIKSGLDGQVSILSYCA